MTKSHAEKIGLRFERLVVLAAEHSPGWGTRFRCKCNCGNEVLSSWANLKSGNTSSCGCKRIVHGGSRSKLYSLWKAMRQRCSNPNDSAFQNYGGRGIKVCERWESFPRFAADMGERPSGTTLERIDNDGPYAPQNCRWATWFEQHDNKRDTRRVTAFGRSQSLAAWAREFGIKERTLYNRINRSGCSIETALSLPLRRGKKVGDPPK